MKRALLLAALAVTGALAGCFHADGEVTTTSTSTQLVASNDTLDKIRALAAAKPLRFSFPLQQERASHVVWINGTVGPDAVTSYEFPGNRGGTTYNTIIRAEDISPHLPPGQPALIEMRLWWNNGPGRGAKLDPYVDVPGAKTHIHRGYQDEWTWTLPVKNASVATIGVAGEPALLGVQISNAKIAPGQEIQYTLRAEFHYARDVLTPYVPWELDVPANASALILSSVKFRGDSHVAAKILVVGPDDELVQYVDFNDLAVPTESVLVPIRQAGPHVLYAIDMASGFMSVRADVGLDQPAARPLGRVVTETLLVEDPAAPGTTQHSILGQNMTQRQGGVTRAFAVGPAFPLRIEPFLTGVPALVVDADLAVLNGERVVARYHRFLRLDDERGAIGVSDEEAFGNRVFNPQNLGKGEMALHAVVLGSTAKAGVRVVTYAR